MLHLSGPDILVIVTALLTACVLLFYKPLAASASWRATVTPLATIMGGSFLFACYAGEIKKTRNLLGLRVLFSDGAERRNRTTDTRIFNPLLYRLSYLGISKRAGIMMSKGRFVNPLIIKILLYFATAGYSLLKAISTVN